MTAFGPLVMLTVCFLLRPVEPKPAQGRLLDFAPVFQNTEAMGFMLGYGAHCFELYGIRTWIVAFWTFVTMRNSGRLDPDADRRQRGVLAARDAREHSRQ